MKLIYKSLLIIKLRIIKKNKINSLYNNNHLLRHKKALVKRNSQKLWTKNKPSKKKKVQIINLPLNKRKLLKENNQLKRKKAQIKWPL